MRRMTVLALVAVIALVGAACGGDDDDATTEDTEASDDAATTDDGGDDGDGGDATSALADVINGKGGCVGAAAAVSATIGVGFNPQAAEGLDENSQFFDDFAASVPDDIKEDVDLMAEYFGAYADAFGEFDAQDLTDADTRAEIQETMEALEESYPSEDLQAASDNVSAWFTEECPALAGS